MVLVWTLDYVKFEEDFKVVFTRTYINGKFAYQIKSEEKEVLVNYLTLFPKRDIVRLKLGSSEDSLYNLIYFYKDYMYKGFVGLFSFSEYNTKEPFIWEKQPKLMYRVFGKFIEEFPNLFKDSGIEESKANEEYFDWLDKMLWTFYIGWKNAREEFYKQPMNQDLNKVFSGEKSALEIDSQIDQILDGLDGIPMVNEVSISWQLQLINSYGNPITDIIRFQDGMFFASLDEDIQFQSIEAMNYSVLKGMAERSKRRLRNMQSRLPDNTGFEYIFFQNVKDSNLILIMEVLNIDLETKKGLKPLLGFEHNLISVIADEITQMPEIHNDDIISDELSKKTTKIIKEKCLEYYNRIKEEMGL